MITTEILPVLPLVESMKAWAFERSINAALITNSRHEIIAVNKAFLDCYGYRKEEVMGMHAGALLHSDSLGPELEKQIPESLEARGSWQGEVINRAKNGEERPFLLTITSIISPDGQGMGYFGLYIDLSERKRLEGLVAQGEKLSNIGESVATLMHEVRNPLSGIAMNVFMMEDAAVEGKTWTKGDHESLQLISKEVRRLDTLVRGALSYARETRMHPERVCIKYFFDEIKTLVAHAAQRNSVDIHLKPLEAELTSLFDSDLMKQVFLNLLQNAIEAASCSSERTVRLGARISEDPKWRFISSSARVLLMNVDNSGERISSEHAEKLFRPFFTSKPEGIGLGLATASKIVRQHHGILSHYQIDDAPYNTRFTVVLPI